MTDSAILRFNRDLLFEIETDGTPEGSIVTAPFSGTIPGGGPVLSFESKVETVIPLIVDINPFQEGSGDPSPDNVRPISGYTDVNVNVAGGNIFDKNLYPFLRDDSNNGWYISGTRLQKGGSSNATIGMPCKPNTRYRITVTIDYPLLRIAYGQMADLSFQTGSTDQTVYNTQADTTTIGYREVIYQTGADATFLFIQFPYGYHEEGVNSLIVEEIANTYPISLGQTVYGGVLDVVSGKLTVFPYYSSYNGQTLNGEWICDRAVYSQGTTPPTGSQVVDMSGTGTELTLTPTEVMTLIGWNNIWSNSGDVYTIISTGNVTYKITGGAEDVQRFDKIWRSLLLYRDGGLTDRYKNLSGKGVEIISHGPAILKED